MSHTDTADTVVDDTMVSDEPGIIDDLPTLLATIGIDGATVAADNRGTIVPPQTRPRTRDEAALQALPEIAIEATEAAGAELELGETIGEGGMGLIRSAVQVPLARDVAVKSVRPERIAPETTLALLREAWVTGSLEHPNVVPVHTLGRDDSGQPLLVMKRIEGVAWDRIIRGADGDPTRSGAHDPLGRDLDILIAVCNALAFAHSRGVVHRDVKPENVMVGPFGEVYVLDWGLAVTVDESSKYGIPRAADIRGIAGTPHYMSPEMVVGDATRIGKASDVYLLGAILHEILTGTHRHYGRTLMDVLKASKNVQPFAYDDDVPSELGAVANRATARDPSKRFPDAASFRAAVTRFVRNRHALEVARNATERLHRLETLCAVDEPDDAIQDEIAGLLAECRFGFQMAIREAPELQTAHDGLRKALTTVCSFEIRMGRAATARSLLGEIRMPDADLVAAFDALLKRQEAEAAEVERLHKLQANLDLTTGTRTRAFLSIVLSVLYGAALTLAGLAEDFGWFTWGHGHNLFLAVDFLSAGVIGMWWARDTLTRTAVNRRLASSVIGLGVADVVFAITGALSGASALDVVILMTATIGCWFLTIALTVDRRLLASTLIFFVAAPLAAAFRPWAWYIVGAANFLGPFAAAWLWRPARGELLPPTAAKWARNIFNNEPSNGDDAEPSIES